MAFSTDQQDDPRQLSATSRRVLALREAVLAEWETRVRAAFAEAKELRHPVFINTIPAFYDNIAEALTPGYPRANAVDGTTLATAHGGERARLTNYDPELLILEYQIFRLALFDVLHANGVTLTVTEISVITASVDAAIREAVAAFSVVATTLREQFVAALAHDLRTPLHAASMATDVLRLSRDPHRLEQFADIIKSNLTRMDKMLEGSLDTMVFQRGERRRLDLAEFDMLEAAREVCAQSFARDAYRCHLDGESVTGWWSREAMKRAMENLLGNAFKYGVREKTVTVKIHQAHERLILSVHNDGPPIPAGEQALVFKLFRRSGDAKGGAYQGWGVGLPYVRAVVESHGGTIVVDSSAERGTTFTIDIPQDARPFQEVATSQVVK